VADSGDDLEDRIEQEANMIKAAGVSKEGQGHTYGIIVRL